MTRVLVLQHGPITITREIEDGLEVHAYYWIGGRSWRVVRVEP